MDKTKCDSLGQSTGFFLRLFFCVWVSFGANPTARGNPFQEAATSDAKLRGRTRRTLYMDIGFVHSDTD
jgi:hypothetical protein